MAAKWPHLLQLPLPIGRLVALTATVRAGHVWPALRSDCRRRATVHRSAHQVAVDDRKESESCFSNIPIRQNSVQLTGARSLHDNDGVQWLTLLLRVAVIP
jgi:hypothetical protein